MSNWQSLLNNSARRVGKFLGRSHKTVKTVKEVYKTLPELIHQTLIFYGFIQNSIYLLQQSLDGPLSQHFSTIKKKYKRIIPPEILEKFLPFVISEMQNINPKQLMKYNSLMADKLNLQEKSEFLGVLIQFAQDDNVLTESKIKYLKQIAYSLKVDDPLFNGILGRFAPGVKVVDPDYFYSLLGVNRGASSVEIKKAYHQMAGRFHPDLFTNHTPSEQAEAEKQFIKINQAYQNLRS